MTDTIWELLLLFFGYAVLGWAGTVAVDAFRTGRFVNAGTLNGPVNLTCGVVLTLTATLSERYATNFVGLFLLTTMIITAAGPICGFLSERVLGRKLWDYASGEYNTFNGWRGLARTLIATTLALIVVLFLHPYLYIAVQLIPLTVLKVIDIVLLSLLGGGSAGHLCGHAGHPLPGEPPTGRGLRLSPGYADDLGKPSGLRHPAAAVEGIPRAGG